MNQKNFELLRQCREVLAPLSGSFEKQELLIGLLLACQAASAHQRAYQAIEAAGEEAEDESAYAARGAVPLPPHLRWEALNSLRGQELEAGLAALLEELGRRVPALRGAVKPELWARRINPGQLERLWEIFDVFYRQSLSGPFCFTELLEDILACFPYESTGRRFFTPTEIVRLLAGIMRPEGGSLYDPCCGNAGLLVSMADDMARRQRRFDLYGHEGDEFAWRLSKLRLYLGGFPAKLGDRPANALTLPPDALPKADVIVANPPYHSSWRQGDDAALAADPRWKYGIPPRGNGNLAWLQLMLYALKDPGVLSVILNTSSLSSPNPSETGIRRGIVEDGLLEAVFLLPSRMFYGTNTAVSIWFLRKGGTRTQTLMLDARELGVPCGGKLVLEQEGRQRILDAWQKFCRGAAPAEPGFCATAGQRDIAKQNWTLDPRKYIAYPPPPLPSWEELEQRDAEQAQELGRLLAENREILRRIRKEWEGAGSHEPGDI